MSRVSVVRVSPAPTAPRHEPFLRGRGLRLLGLALALAALWAPSPAVGQGAWTVTPSLQFAEEYTDNVFGTASNRESDFISQFTPGLTLLYDARNLKLELAYFATLEIYADHSNLDNFGENQRGLVRFEYRPEERLGLHLNAYYARTNDPSTFLVPTAAAPPDVTVVPTVETTRRETTQVSLNAGTDYRFTPRFVGRADYDFIFLHQEGTDDGYTHTGTLRGDYQLTSTDDLLGTLSGSILESTDTDTSAALLLGWRRRWTEPFTTSFAVGPRVTDGDWGGAVEASADYQAGRQWSFRAAYSLGTGLAAGTTGAQNVSALFASVAFQATRELQFSADGGWTRTWALEGDAGETTNAYGAGISAAFRITYWLVASLSYRYIRQDSDQQDSIATNQVVLALTASYPFPLGR